MEKSAKVVNGVIWSIMANIINAIYGFVSIPFLIDYYGKGEYGLIGMALSINVYVQLMDMGLNSTNIRFFSVWLEKKQIGLVTSGFQFSLYFYTIIGLINSLILLILTFNVDSVFNVTAEQALIMKKLLSVIAFSAIINWYSSSFEQLLSATENVAWIKKISILPKICQLIILFIAIKFHFNIVTFFLLTTYSVFITLPLTIAKIKKTLPFVSFKPKWDYTILKMILPYSIGIFSFSIFQFSYQNLRPIILGIQGTPEIVTDFRILHSLTMGVMLISGVYISALLPITSKIVSQGKNDAYYKVAYNATKYITIILSFCCFGLMSVGEYLILLYVGKSFAYLTFWLNLMLLAMLGANNQAISSLILSGTNLKPLTYSSMAASIIALLACWWLTSYLGVGAAVIASLLYTLIQQSFYHVYYYPQILEIDVKRLLKDCTIPPILLGSFVYGVCLLIPRFDSAISGFIFTGIIFSCIYILFCFKILTKQDIAFIKKIFISKVK